MNKIGAAIIFTNGNKVLLLQRSDSSTEPGTWDFPGGGTQGEETFLQTAKRECKEEIGMFPTSYTLGNAHSSNPGFQYFTMLTKSTFECDLNNEHTRYMWVDLNDVNHYNLHPKIKENLGNIKESIMSVKNENMITFKDFMELQEIAGGTFDLAAPYKNPKPDTYQVEGDPSSMIRPKKRKKKKSK